jgi:hypothetical protein
VQIQHSSMCRWSSPISLEARER